MSTELDEAFTGNEFTAAMAASVATSDTQVESPVAPEQTIETPVVESVPESESTPVVQATQAVQENVDPGVQPDRDTAAILRDSARRLGLEVRDEDSPEDLALAALQNLHALRVAQAQQIAQAKPPAPAPVQPAPEKEWNANDYFQEKWGVNWTPEFDQAVASGIVVQDPETNLYVAKPGYEVLAQQILPKLNEAHRAIHDKWSKLTKGNLYQNVYEATRDPILREVERIVEERMARAQQQTQTMSVVDRFEQENASWMYATDPVTRQAQPTPEGQRLIQAVQASYASGESDPGRAIQWALQVTGLSDRAGQRAVAATPPPAQVQAQTPAPTPSQSPQQSFLERARSANAYSPSANGPGTDPGLQVSSEEDLNNLFSRALQTQKRG